MAPRTLISSVELVINANEGLSKIDDSDCILERTSTFRSGGDRKQVEPEEHWPECARHIVGTLLGVFSGLFLSLSCLAGSFVASMGPMQAMGLKFLSSALFLGIVIGIVRPQVE